MCVFVYFFLKSNVINSKKKAFDIWREEEMEEEEEGGRIGQQHVEHNSRIWGLALSDYFFCYSIFFFV